ncbi:hypothetical protein [Nonomuraea salmonea]|uniref:Alpha/beta hydrolase n=1 Tax=Nonomuraea salmonea TaxID=46181 RepID=A0ABV5P1G5_9ACTN
MQNVNIGSEEFGAAADEPILLISSHEPAKPGHGAIIAEQIPDARLMIVQGMGHTLPPEVHDEPATAILTHTAG